MELNRLQRDLRILQRATMFSKIEISKLQKGKKNYRKVIKKLVAYVKNQRKDTPTNAPIATPENPGFGLGIAAENDSPWATLDRISTEGDSDLAMILTELRRMAVDAVRLWRPIVTEIVPKKIKIIKWILKPNNVHKFKTFQTSFRTAQTSVWKELVHELFPHSESPAALITYFGNASRSPQFFGSFVE